MFWRELRDQFLPVCEECEQGFGQEIRRLSVRGLRMIGAVDLLMWTVTWVLMALGVKFPHVSSDPGLYSFLLPALGLATIGVSYTTWGQRHARDMGLLSGILTAAVLSILDVVCAPNVLELERVGEINLLTIMLVGLAALPVKPSQMLILGLCSSAFHIASVEWAMVNRFGMKPEIDLSQFVMLGIMTLLSAALAGANYRRIFDTYTLHHASLKQAEELRKAETRALISENGASMGRLAAALSHELNTPLGALKSSVATMVAAASRPAPTVAEQERAGRVLRDLSANVLESTARLEQIVRRMQRYTNLDRAEVQSIDVNSLIQDVVAIVEATGDNRVRVALDLGPLPPIVSRPQPLSAVFSSLFDSALRTTQTGHIHVETKGGDTEVHVFLQEDGTNVPEQKLASLFEPAFEVEGSRVAANNWGLFSARQVIRELGGDICAENGSNGTRLRVTLPLAA